MHWIVNTCLRREGGYNALIYNLDRQEIPYTLVRKPPFADYLVNMDNDEELILEIDGPVFVTGTTSMGLVSKKMGWAPGYIDSPGIRDCIDNWGDQMLNHDAIFGAISDIIPPEGTFFTRPDEDSKSYPGMIIHSDDFIDWRKDLMAIDGYTTIPPEQIVMMCPIKIIWAEYRCSVVDGRVVTASRYKTGKTVAYSQDVGPRIIDFANERVKEWNPRIAFTLDVADTPEGLKVIETNAISSSGFYALDMGIWVHEINKLGERDEFCR